MIHKTAEVAKTAKIGKNTKIWNQAQVRENAQIGENCVIGKNVYIDHDVKIGNRVKIQNNVSIFFGVTVEDDVFIAPHVCFTNDLLPRASNADGTAKSDKDWTVSKTIVHRGASIGANSTILPVEIGEYALIGAGSVVTKNVDAYSLVFGNPAKFRHHICKCGEIVYTSGANCGKCLNRGSSASDLADGINSPPTLSK